MRADGSGAMFDGIAHRYDLLNRVMSLGMDQGWRARLVRALELSGESRVLDVATGTADVALAVARAHPRARIIGLDPSTSMVAIGREKVQRAGLGDRVQLTIGDARRLPFTDGAFDATCISFGIRNVPDRPAALAEMARVTKPGGRVAILELSEPRRPGAIGALTRFHVHSLVPRLGAWLSGSREYEYLQRSIASFPPPGEFCTMMGVAGLVGVTVTAVGFGAAHLFVGSAPPQ